MYHSIFHLNLRTASRRLKLNSATNSQVQSPLKSHIHSSVTRTTDRATKETQTFPSQHKYSHGGRKKNQHIFIFIAENMSFSCFTLSLRTILDRIILVCHLALVSYNYTRMITQCILRRDCAYKKNFHRLRRQHTTPLGCQHSFNNSGMFRLRHVESKNSNLVVEHFAHGEHGCEA